MAARRELGAGWLGFESWPYHLLAGFVWAVMYLTYLSFLICKIQLITVPPSQPGHEVTRIN